MLTLVMSVELQVRNCDYDDNDGDDDLDDDDDNDDDDCCEF